MYRALSEYLIRGIDTNVEFVKAVVLDPAFRQGWHPMWKNFWLVHQRSLEESLNN